MKFTPIQAFSTTISFLFLSFSSTSLLAAALPIPQAVDSDHSVTTPLSDSSLESPRISGLKEPSHWPKVSRQIIKWDTDKIPQDKMDATGLILLGYLTPGDENEHLDVERPLASDFYLTEGEIEIFVPEDFASRKDYFIVLFGDSGNISPKLQFDQDNQDKPEDTQEH